MVGASQLGGKYNPSRAGRGVTKVTDCVNCVVPAFTILEIFFVSFRVSLSEIRWEYSLQHARQGNIQREFTQIQIERQAETLRTHYAAMHSEEQASALRGEGRTSIVPEEPESSVPVSEHLEGCVCKICSPNLRRPGSLDALDNVENF